MRIANTTSIASATQPPGFSPRNVGSASGIELGLYRRGGFFWIDAESGQSLDYFARGVGRDGFDLGPRRIERLADLRLGGFKLHGDLVRRLLDLGFGVASGRLLRVVRELRCFRPRRIHPLPPRSLGRVGR